MGWVALRRGATFPCWSLDLEFALGILIHRPAHSHKLDQRLANRLTAGLDRIGICGQIRPDVAAKRIHFYLIGFAGVDPAAQSLMDQSRRIGL